MTDASTTGSRPRPTSVLVLGLYDEYDHRIDFPASDEFAIIYGPNGIGKTRVFEIVYAMSKLDVAHLLAQPFQEARIEYDTSHTFVASRVYSDDHEPHLEFDLHFKGRPVVHYSSQDFDRSRVNRRTIRMGASTWRPFAPSRWVDELDGEIVTTAELRQRYGLRVKVELGELPEELVAFTQSVPVHRIDTQRLISANELPPHQIPPHRGRVQFEEVDEEAPTVLRYASDLKRRLSDALARNSRTTQALDRTFPARLLASDQSSLTELEIRDRYNTQSQRRELLTRISLIENDAELPLPARTLLAWERIVLTKYLDDTEEKLSTFDDIVERVTLLEEILNRRLLRKSIRVSVEEGIAITTPDHRSIALTDLSSGEQHELILAYDLLFRAETGSLVLIDEPEISLHVAWQRAFMNDMLRICQVSGVRVIIATHSPQIIGKWWDRTQRLGPEFDQPGWSEE